MITKHNFRTILVNLVDAPVPGEMVESSNVVVFWVKFEARQGLSRT